MESCRIHCVIQNLVNVVLFERKDLLTSEMTAKLKNNLHAWPVNISLIFYSHGDVIKWKPFPVPGEFPAQRPVTRSFDVFFDLRLNEQLSKQSWSWWFGTPSRPLWRHCNVHVGYVAEKNDIFLHMWATLHVYVLTRCGSNCAKNLAVTFR